jgi:hypothetical protein
MKRSLFVLALCLSGSVAFCQGNLLNQVKSEAQTVTGGQKTPSLGDITSMKNNIMDNLSSNLSLSALQKTNVTKAVTDFLTKKAELAPMLNSNKAAYAQKLSGLKTTLYGKMKKAVTGKQYTKFMGLKQKVQNTENPLSNLF